MPRTTRNSTRTTTDTATITAQTEQQQPQQTDSRHPRTKRGPYARATPEKRKKIVDSVVLNNLSTQEVASRYRVATSTVNSMVNVFLKEGRYDIKKMGGRKNVKITGEISGYLRDCLDEDNVTTLMDLQQKVFNQFDLELTLSTIHYHIDKKIGYTLKISRQLPLKRNDDDTLNQRSDFITRVTASDIKYNFNCIFVDEAGFNSSQVRKFARSKRGEPANVFVQKTTDLNLTILAALLNKGIEKIHAKVVPGGTNAQIFLDFLKVLIDSLKDETIPQYIILDNARIHHAVLVREWLEEINKTAPVVHHQLCFLPPYSPFLNPVEEYFSKMKYFVKRQSLTERQNLQHCIEAAGNTIKRDCEGWIRHSQSFFPRSLAKELGLKGKVMTVAKEFFGVWPRVVSQLFKPFPRGYDGISNKVIAWPKTTEMVEEVARGFEFPQDQFTTSQNKRLAGCIGTVDGKLINIYKPRKNAQSYRDRKRHISTNLLAVCKSDYKFTYIYVMLENPVCCDCDEEIVCNND